ncbi:spore coat protein [Schinkia sp. CFF1]
MNNFLKNLMGMGGMTDQVIATDFLMAAKSGIKNLAFALTESSTSTVREELKKQLKHAVETHERIINYMIENGMYHPYDLREQLQMDLKITDTALKLSQQT